MIGRLIAVIGVGVMLPVVLIVLLVAASPDHAAAVTALSWGAALNGAAIPNPAWVPWVDQAGGLCPTFPAPVIAAQIDTESKWNPNAVSPAGAEGLAQFLPSTWPSWGQDDAGDGNVSPFNPPDAIMAMGRFDCALAQAVIPIAASSRQSVLTLALDAYNAGLGAVQAADGIPPNSQTQMYAPIIQTLAATYAAQMATESASAFDTAELAAAEGEIGVPYVWGGGGPTGPTNGGFDCSGLVLYAVYQASAGTITLPHSSEAQVGLGTPVTSGPGAEVLASGRLTPGDVIGFYNLDGDNQWDHIGIYIGAGQMIDAPTTGQTVRIDTLTTPYWENTLWTVRNYG